MKTVTIDTNAYSYFKRGSVALADCLSRAESVIVPVPVLAELRCGFRCGIREQQNLSELEAFLSSPRVQIGLLGEHTAILFAEIFAVLKKNGTPIPVNDVWIAASAMEHGSVLLTDDEHFAFIPGLLVNSSKNNLGL